MSFFGRAHRFVCTSQDRPADAIRSIRETQDLQKAGAIASQLMIAFRTYCTDDTSAGQTKFLAATDDNAMNVSSLDFQSCLLTCIAR